MHVRERRILYTLKMSPGEFMVRGKSRTYTKREAAQSVIAAILHFALLEICNVL